MKRKTLIRAAALALTAALLFTGCTARTPEENPESSGSSQSSMAEPEKTASSGTKAAAVAVPLENAPSIIPMPEERPYLYEEIEADHRVVITSRDDMQSAIDEIRAAASHSAG